MKAALTFDAHVSHPEATFEVDIEFDVKGLPDAQMSLPLAKELLVHVAIAITNPEGLEELARQLVAAKKQSNPTLRLLRSDRKEDA